MQIYLVVVHIFNWLLGHQKPQLTSWQNWCRAALPGGGRVAGRGRDAGRGWGRHWIRIRCAAKVHEAIELPTAPAKCVCWLLFSYDDSLTLRLTLTLTLALAICNCRTAELMFALLNISCDLRYISGRCTSMFFPLCLLAPTDLNNFLRQPFILHRQLQFSIIFTALDSLPRLSLRLPLSLSNRHYFYCRFSCG